MYSASESSLPSWDSAYQRELNNVAESEDADIEDVSEVWFTFDSIKRALAWIEKEPKITHSSRLPPTSHVSSEFSLRILDVGCGNAAILLEMAGSGYTELFGVDYSEGAIELAQAFAERAGATLALEARPTAGCTLMADPRPAGGAVRGPLYRRCL